MSERFELPLNSKATECDCDADLNTTEFDVALKKGVREPPATPGAHRDDRERSKRPAHPSNRLVAQLNATWRVVDDPLQWRLQRKKGNPRTKNSGWRDRSFCTTREGLLRCVREYCGNVEPTALAKVTALPEHLGMPNLDVRGTDQAHFNGQSQSRIPRGPEDSGAEKRPPRITEPALYLFVSQGD